MEEPYEMRVARQRCGPEIADQLVPAELLVAVMAMATELQERIDGVEAVLSGRLAGLQTG
jgi:hypothetical protein